MGFARHHEAPGAIVRREHLAVHPVDEQYPFIAEGRRKLGEAEEHPIAIPGFRQHVLRERGAAHGVDPRTCPPEHRDERRTGVPVFGSVVETRANLVPRQQGQFGGMELRLAAGKNDPQHRRFLTGRV